MRLVACRSAGEGRRELKKRERERDRVGLIAAKKKPGKERREVREKREREGKSSRAPVPC